MSKDAILDAAAEIFSQKGYHAASMQDIARAVRLQKASLYHHVNSKQEILKALLDKALDLLIENMLDVMVRPTAAEEKLRLGMRTYLMSMLEHRQLASVLLLEHRSLEPELRVRHTRRRDEFERLWRVLIQEGVDEGYYQCDDIDIAARALLGVLNWTITWYRPEGADTPEQIADQYADMFLRGLLVREMKSDK